MRKQCDILQSENTQLRTNSDLMKDKIEQLTTQLDKTDIKQSKQIDSQYREITRLKTEVQQLKVSQ